MTGEVALVSLGPGDASHMTPAAREALAAADTVIGYRGYVHRISPLLRPDQTVRAYPLGHERRRAKEAVRLAQAGHRVALVSSGDVGIYGMAAALFEVLEEAGWDGVHPEVTIYPGVSALQAAAARVGAPLGHDFCAISLSDRLTPWEIIARRLAAAAWADFVVVLFNPRSRGRPDHLAWALEILRGHRPADTPVAFVRNAMRPQETVRLVPLAQADPTWADMFTLVIVGSSTSRLVGGRMLTPRGYTTMARPAVDGDPIHPSPERVYPILLTHPESWLAVVVGGGPVAERKVRGLLAVGARVRVISPQVTPRLQRWAAEGRVQWLARPYRPGDLAAARLAFAATNDRTVNARIAREAQALGVWCNVADAPAEGDFHVPAIYRDDEAIVAVGTGGRSPRYARLLRDRLAAMLAADRRAPAQTERSSGGSDDER